MKEKCYISGKITGLSVEEFTALFEAAKQEVIALGYEPVSPTELTHAHDKSWQSYMREDIVALMDCKHIYALRNWRSSAGAVIEVTLCFQLGINVIYQEQNLMGIRQAKAPIEPGSIVHWEHPENCIITGCELNISKAATPVGVSVSEYVAEVNCKVCLQLFEQRKAIRAKKALEPGWEPWHIRTKKNKAA